MVDERDNFTDGRMFNEMCSLQSPNRPQTYSRIKSHQPTTLYEHFKQSTFDEPQYSRLKTTTKTNNKQVVTKEEAQKLRDSVLKSTRPLNPYFERFSSLSPNYRNSLNSNNSPTNCTATTPCPNNNKEADVPKRWTLEVRPVPIICSKTPSNKRPQQSKGSNKSILQNCTQPDSNTIQRPKQDFVYLDTFEDETPSTGLRTLEQLETENRRRITRVELNTSDEFPSPSTYYFSDDCSTTGRSDFHNDDSPKQVVYNRKNFPVCAECKLYIKHMILQAIGKSFHPECFCCCECSKSLDGVPFAVNEVEQVFCMSDYERLYVPICARCKTSIKPPNTYGQIVRVVALDREYHIRCYSCESCGLQLTNEDSCRCYPIGETLLCRKCNLRWQQLGGSMSPLTDL